MRALGFLVGARSFPFNQGHGHIHPIKTLPELVFGFGTRGGVYTDSLSMQRVDLGMGVGHTPRGCVRL